MSVKLREWQYKDTLDERDKVWDCLADEWAVHMYEEGGSLALQSMQQAARDCTRMKRTRTCEAGPCVRKGQNQENKKEVEHPRSAEGWVEGTCADPWRQDLSCTLRFPILHRGLRWTSQVLVHVKAPFSDLLCM